MFRDLASTLRKTQTLHLIALQKCKRMEPLNRSIRFQSTPQPTKLGASDMVKHVPNERLNFESGGVDHENELVSSVEIIETQVSSVENSQAKTKKTKKMKSKIPNSMQKVRKVMENLRRDNKMQLDLIQSEIDKEMGGSEGNWHELLAVTKHKASDRISSIKSKPYLYAAGASGLGEVLSRNHSSRKSQKSWTDSNHH
jgi:hypothetical protein